MICFLLFTLFLANSTTTRKELLEIPKTFIDLDVLNAVPFPDSRLKLDINGSLSGQPSSLSADPIWDICSTNRFIFASYPNKNLVIRYSFGNEATQIIGPQGSGGNGTPLHKPGNLAWVNGGLTVCSLETGDVFILDINGEIANFDSLKPTGVAGDPLVNNPLPGPIVHARSNKAERMYLLLSTHSANRIAWVNHRGQLLARFGFGPDPRTRITDPMDWNFRSTAIVAEDGSVVLSTFSSGVIVHFEHGGLVTERFMLQSKYWPQSTPYPLRPGLETVPLDLDPLKACQFQKGVYWVLLELNQAHWLLKLTPASQTLFNLKDEWDGLTVTQDYLVLFLRKNGRARIYTHP